MRIVRGGGNVEGFVDDGELVDGGDAFVGEFFESGGDDGGVGGGEWGEVGVFGGSDDEEGDAIFAGDGKAGGGVAGVGDHHRFLGFELLLDAEEGHEVADADVQGHVKLGVGDAEEVADAIIAGPVEVDLVAGGSGVILEEPGADGGEGKAVLAREGVAAEGFVLRGCE